MTNTQYLKQLESQNIHGVWRMYLLYCYVNNVSPSKFENLRRWLHDEV